MARLHIYVADRDGQTQSKFGKPKDSDKVVFHNQHPTETLTISVQGEPQAGSALCKGSQGVDTFTVTSAEQKKAFTICKDYAGETFKYTATIAGSSPEDPVIIIERGKLHGPSVPVLAAAGLAVVAFALGAVVARSLSRNRKPAQS